jgi:hypothetical protein
MRSAGGYVVLPSTGNGRAWIKPLGIPLAKPPMWLPTAKVNEPGHPLAPSLVYTTWSPAAYCGATRYGVATLRAISADIAAAPNGSQETTLNAGAFKVGRLIGASELGEDAVEALIAAGLSMPSYDACRPWDPAQIEAKVLRAVEQGSRRPWTGFAWLDEHE